MYSAVAILWNALAIAGHVGTLSLLLTLVFVPLLPQRQNTFYVSLLVISYLSTVPAALLFITGQQGGVTNQSICDAQAALLDGVLPSLSISLLILTLHTWCELRSMILQKRNFIDHSSKLRILLTGIPYINWAAWSLGSWAAAAFHKGRVALRPDDFVFCAGRGQYSFLVRSLIGPFCVTMSVLCTLLAVLSMRLLTKREWSLGNTKGTVWSTYRQHVTVLILLRVAILILFQIIPLVLTLVNRTLGNNSALRGAVANATQLSEIFIPLLVFLVFATQRNILQAWKILPRSEAPIVEYSREV